MDYRNVANQREAILGASVPKDIPEQISKIRDGISTSEQLLSELHDTLNHLEGRLDTVLTPQPPSTAAQGNVTKTSPPSSHLYGRVEILNEGYQHAIARVRALIGRIEL